MPRYDFRCKACQHTFTLTIPVSEVDEAAPRCPRCDAPDPDRVIRRVSVVASEETRLERMADPSRLSALESDDPKAMGRLMREMAAESGEDLGSEFGEVVDRLESGESPDAIEQSMDLSGPPGGDDLF